LNATEPERLERGAFLDAIEGVLRPLMPVVLSYGVGASDIGQVLKTLYIETLSARLKDQGRAPTVARLALMAGLNRSEVERLLEAQSERRRLRNQSTAKLDQLSQLLALWHDDSRFSTPYGAPLDLSLEPERNFKTFAELVEAAKAGSDPGLVLDELVAAGCVEVHVQKFARCVSRAFVPTGVDALRIMRLGRYVGAMCSNFAHNLLRPTNEPSYFERVLITVNPVKRAVRDETLAHLHATAVPFLAELDRWLETKDAECSDPSGKRYGVCMFFFEETPSPNEIFVKESLTQLN
jgi:uncharacterized protein DUF6502